MSKLAYKARQFAEKAHAAQTRKYTGEPYVVHCHEVAKTLAEIGARDQVVAAGYLHDTIEDCGVTREQIAAEFGDEVARLVWEVTDQSKPNDGNREVRKEIDREHIAGASADAKTIKLADLLSNTRTIVAHDPHFAVTYLREKRLLMALLTTGDPTLYRRTMDALEAGEAGLK